MGNPTVVARTSAAALVWSRRRALDLAVLGLFLALAFIITGGMLLHPSHELAINDSDVALMSWFLEHTAHAIAQGGDGLLVTDDMNAPSGISLVWNTTLLLPGILLAPLTWLTSGRTSFAVLLWLGPALSAFAAYWALGVAVRGRALVVGRIPRLAGGLLFGFSPALIAQSLGHLNLTLLPLVPVILLLIVEAAIGDRSLRRVGVAAGLAAAAQLLIGEEVLFLTAIVGVLLLIALVLSRPRQLTRERAVRFVTIGGLALVTFLVVAAVPLFVQFFGPHRMSGSSHPKDFFKLDVTAFTTPTQLLAFSSTTSNATSAGYQGGPEEHTGYLGWPLLVAAAVALVLRWRDLRVRIPILVSVVLSVLALGAQPLVYGWPHEVTLPWGWLIEVPFFRELLVSRLPLMTALLLGVALAAGLEHVASKSLLAAGALAGIVLLPLTPVPLETAPRPPVPSFFTTGAQFIPAGSTAVIAPPATYGHVDALRWQRAAGFRFRLAGGYFIGPSDDGQAMIGPPPRTLLGLLNIVWENGGSAPLTPDLRAAALADLDYYDATAIVVGPMPHRAEAEALIADLLGRAPMDVGGVSLWLISSA